MPGSKLKKVKGAMSIRLQIYLQKDKGRPLVHCLDRGEVLTPQNLRIYTMLRLCYLLGSLRLGELNFLSFCEMMADPSHTIAVPVSGRDPPPLRMEVSGYTASSSTTPAVDSLPNTSCGNDTAQRRAGQAKNTRRRRRTTFTQAQLRLLEDVFSRQQYLVGNERLRLATLLNIGVAEVKVWFQNRRIRWRRAQREMLITTRAHTTTSTSSTNFSLTSMTVTALSDGLMSSSALSTVRQKPSNES